MKPPTSLEHADWFPQTEDIRLYCGICEDDLNGLPVRVGPFGCISPVYGRTLHTKRVNSVKLAPETRVIIQDSGAFCDGPGSRLSFADALERQIKHAERYWYTDLVRYRASYDLLIDEKWVDGQRRKQRWSETEAWEACIETIGAAKFLSHHRAGLPCILSAQGVTASQYLKCVQGVLLYLQPEDMLGLGGWCILGKYPSLLPVFREMLHLVIPFVGREGVKHIHLWGCLYAPALGELLYWCDQFGIHLSVDSVGPSLRPVFGRWGYSYWVDRSYRRPPLSQLGRHRAAHVYLVRRWLRAFRVLERRHYCWRPIRQHYQFFDDESAKVLVGPAVSAKEHIYESEYCRPVQWDGLEPLAAS